MEARNLLCCGGEPKFESHITDKPCLVTSQIELDFVLNHIKV